jgi:hypothetical protein
MSSGFSPMAPLGGRAAEMATLRRSTEASVVLRWGDVFGHDEERLELGWVQWIVGVLSSWLL